MSLPRAKELQVLTPDGVAFALPLAGPISRALALSIDSCAMLAAVAAIAKLLQAFAWKLPDLSGGTYVLLQFLLQVFYGMTLEILWRGRTLGKKVLGLRVVDAQGLHLRPSQLVVRNLLRPADALPIAYLLGGTVAFFTPHAQRLGDIAAGTVVVRTSKRPSHATDAGADKFNSFRAHPAMEARLRQRTTPEEAALLARALARREMLDPLARAGLFADLAARFRGKVRFPDEIAIALTDEQYLRNCADCLFRKAR